MHHGDIFRAHGGGVPDRPATVVVYRIPFVSAFIGWITNWKRRSSSLLPQDFLGHSAISRLAGHRAAQGGKMAGMAIDLITSKLLSVDEMFSRIDPQKMAEAMRGPMLAITPSLIHETMEEYAPRSGKACRRWCARAHCATGVNDLPQVIADIIDEMRIHPAEVLGFATDGHRRLQARDVSLLNRIFQTVGDEARIPLYRDFRDHFGLPLGVVHVCVVFVQPWWFLPIGGALAGSFTNWLAILMIFSPKHPHKVRSVYTCTACSLRRQNGWPSPTTRWLPTGCSIRRTSLIAFSKGPLSDGVFRIISSTSRPPSTRKPGWSNRSTVHDRHPDPTSR